jgi:hypothetical protein
MSTNIELSDEALKNLWKDTKFSGTYTKIYLKLLSHLGPSCLYLGSFAGLTTFQNALHFDKNCNVSSTRLRSVLTTLPDFIYQLKKVHKIRRRSFQNVGGLGQIWQADLGNIYCIHSIFQSNNILYLS